MEKEAIRFDSVNKTYNNDSAKINAIENISFSVQESQFVSILGPSGCGKTTLLNLICGIIQSDKGEVRVYNREPEKARQNNLFGYVFQTPTLLPWRNVLENIRLPSEILTNKKSKTTHNSYFKLLKLVGLSEFKKNYPYELSFGMQQRVSIARAISFNPKILLMDEPFGALDELTREKLQCDLLSLWKKMKNTVVFVTHNISESIFLSDKVVILSNRPGKIVKTVKINLSRPRHPNIKNTLEFVKLHKKIKKLLKNGN